tara:strand:- start:573 stop:914 length:342 start_codon:yes stop_codon:yes gene_type:complete
MVTKPQKTKFQKNIVENLESINLWAVNPWRKYSFGLIVFLVGYFLGSQIGMISAVIEVFDPIGALFFIVLIEIFISIRRSLKNNKSKNFLVMCIDFLRIGLIYGFFTEGLKLL